MADEARLADLCDAIVDCPHSTPVWTDSGAVVLRNQNIRNGRLDLSERSYTDEAHFIERTKRATPTEGDLVITREAPMGEVCMIPAGLRCCLGQRMVLLRPNRKRTEPRYLLYALQSKSVQHEIGVNEGTGSTVSNLRIPLIESLPIPTRPLPEQRAIAHILGTLDDKIELNRRMNETLEAMARALFKSWFVDFDPVRAKVNLPSPSGRGVGGEGRVGGEGPHCSSHAYPPTELRDFARALRNNQTDAEHLMWRMLRDRRIAGAKFRRQHPVTPYVLDFYCHELKLAIELDGGQHGEPTGLDRDRQRDAALSERGITVLRFWTHEVLNETEAVLEQIYWTVTERVSPSPPTPLPEGEGLCGLPKEIADLFPDRFVDSGLGEIPEGWGVGSLADLASLNSETWSKGTRPDVINYVDLSNTKWGRIETITAYAPQDAPSRAQRVLRPRDTIVGTVRPGNGSYAFISEDGLTGSTGFAVLRPLSVEYAEFVYLAATAAENIEALAHLADGGAYPAVRPEVVAATPVVRPDDKTLSRFSRTVDPLLTKMAHNEHESRTLAALRDTLLPKLISGELRVKVAEKLIQVTL